MSTISNITGKAAAIWVKYKYYIIGGAAAVVFIILICCCCWCRKKMRKKKKKDSEKLKLKDVKGPPKKLRRIQPGRNEIKVMEELGSLKFVLRYDSVSEMLLTTVIEGDEIPVRDLSGYAYSYVVAKALPLHEHTMEEYKTKLVRAGFWPNFNDTVQFQVDRNHLDRQRLYLYVYEMNRWTKQDGIGQIIVDLHDLGLDLGKEHIIKRNLKSYNPLIGLEVETGAVKLSIEYDSELWTLNVEVLEAEIIPLDESKEKEDSYVVISAINDDGERLKKLKTKVKHGSLRPEYGEKLVFDIPDNLLPDVSLKIALKAKRLLKKNILLGSFVIKPDSEHWKKLLEDLWVTSSFSVFEKPKIDKV